MRIYVSAPYSKGDVCINVRKAIEAGDRLLEMGHTPFIPHLTHFWHYVSPKPYETWLEIDRRWIDCCDAVLRLEGESNGADLEVKYAKNLGKTVYYSLDEIPSWRVLYARRFPLAP